MVFEIDEGRSNTIEKLQIFDSDHNLRVSLVTVTQAELQNRTLAAYANLPIHMRDLILHRCEKIATIMEGVNNYYQKQNHSGCITDGINIEPNLGIGKSDSYSPPNIYGSIIYRGKEGG